MHFLWLNLLQKLPLIFLQVLLHFTYYMVLKWFYPYILLCHGSSHKCSHLLCCKNDNRLCRRPVHLYGKSTTGLEGPLQLLPYHCRVSSQRCCPNKHIHHLPTVGLQKLMPHFVGPFCITCGRLVSRHMKFSFLPLHDTNAAQSSHVSQLRAVSNGHWRVTRTCLN